MQSPDPGKKLTDLCIKLMLLCMETEVNATNSLCEMGPLHTVYVNGKL